jgi:hypothetical protein
MEAVNFIAQSLKADVSKGGSSMCQVKSLRDILLDADITEFLCEAMATVHSHLLEYVSSVKFCVNQMPTHFLCSKTYMTQMT